MGSRATLPGDFRRLFSYFRLALRGERRSKKSLALWRLTCFEVSHLTGCQRVYLRGKPFLEVCHRLFRGGKCNIKYQRI